MPLINPEDYDSYGDSEHISKPGGYSHRNPEGETAKAIAKEATANAKEKRIEQSSKKVANVIQNMVSGKKPHEIESAEQSYIDWINECLREKALSLDAGKDLEFENYKSGGPGGQHKNKGESAVRARHIITGIFATAEDNTEQAANKSDAISRVTDRLIDHLKDWRIILSGGDKSNNAKVREITQKDLDKFEK